MSNPLALLYKATKAKIGAIELDASLTESHDAEVDVTEHPVERGVDVADHIRPKPETVTIEGLVSNRPIGLGGLSSIPVVGGFLTDNESRAQTALTKLIELKDSGTTLTLTTAIKKYENMVMTSLKYPRDAKLGGSVKFTAVFKRIHIVETKTTVLERFEKAVHGAKKPGGPQATGPADEATKRKSFAKQLGSKAEDTLKAIGNGLKKWGG